MLRQQLRKVRANLAQGATGPHLYPLAQMGGETLHACLQDLREAVTSGHRHSSYESWRLLFILKKGRDRYDLLTPSPPRKTRKCPSRVCSPPQP